MINKKEFENEEKFKKELELSLEGANVWSERINKIPDLERKIELLHSDINNLRIDINSLKIENEELKRRFRSHINDIDSAHKE
jgi:hypothetical protein